ncbi:MAG: hypothetical protein LBH25_08985 [Fibromonadaceae bacterium]|jgi:hypothetical protein|nr:hypothetical protein [Fibromonadaceae bacterium]
MTISPVSGSSASTGLSSASLSPIKGVGKEQSSKTVVAQENSDLNSMKPGLDNTKFGPSEEEKKMEYVKGVQKVDTVI